MMDLFMSFDFILKYLLSKQITQDQMDKAKYFSIKIVY